MHPYIPQSKPATGDTLMSWQVTVSIFQDLESRIWIGEQARHSRYLTQAGKSGLSSPKTPSEQVETEERNHTLCTCSSFPLICCYRGNIRLPPSTLWVRRVGREDKTKWLLYRALRCLSCSLFLLAPLHSCNGALATPFLSPFKCPNQSRYYIETCHQSSLIKTP